MAHTKQRSIKRKQPSKKANVKTTPKRIVKNERQNKKLQKTLRAEKKLIELQATHERLNIQNNNNVVVFAIAYKYIGGPGPAQYFAGFGIISMSGNIPSIRGLETGHCHSSYIYQLKSLIQLFKECPEGQSVTVISTGPHVFDFLNGLPKKKDKNERAIKQLEDEIQTIISQKKLVVNSKRHLPNNQQEKAYLQRARDLAAKERDLYLCQQGLGKENCRRSDKRWAIRNALQNGPMNQLPEVQNQTQQTMMMDSNNNNNSNHGITTMPFHHQLPSPLQSAQGNPFLTHLVNNNRNHSSNNNMAQSQREMHRFDIPSLSSQSQHPPRIAHHSQMVHTNQPPTIPLQLPPQQALLPSYKQVGMNVENNIRQVNRGGRGGLNSYHHKHQQGQQQQQQQQHPHVRTTARGSVVGSSSSIHSMMSPQIVTTTIPTPAVAYNDNNNNGGGGSIGNKKMSGHTRLIGTGNHDNDDEETEEVFVDALDDIKNQQDSDNGIIGTMKGWLSTTFRRFGNF